MSSYLIHSDANALFGRLRVAGRLRQLWNILLRRNEGLPNLSADSSHRIFRRQGQRRIEMVPINAIVGSVGRRYDFDAALRPLYRQSGRRWRAVAVAFMSGAGLPPVELVQIDGCYYILDGMHRVSVARALGMTEIEALVD